MRFALIDEQNDTRIIFPVTPEELEVTSDTKKINFSHISAGDSEMPRGTKPLSISYQGLLHTSELAIPYVENETDADVIIEQILDQQKRDRQKMRLIISGTPWNLEVFVDTFKVNYQGKLINFSVTLTEYPNITISKTTNKPTRKAVKRASTKPKPKIYTVKKGDNLWNIARKYTGKGARWTEMWSINKSKSRSKRADLIYPGEKFQLPSNW